LTQQAIADKYELSQNRVSEILSEKTVCTKKTDKPKRKQIQYKINSGTKPDVAATRIIETFGYDIELSLRIEAEINPGNPGRPKTEINNNVINLNKTTQGNKRSYTLNRLRHKKRQCLPFKTDSFQA